MLHRYMFRPSKAFEHYVRKRLGRGRLFFAKAYDGATCRKIFCSPSALSSSPLWLTRQAFSARLSFDFSEVFKKRADFVNKLSLLKEGSVDIVHLL